ncbi:conserved hypothetical protein [Bathymodiolus platifrons methanotrophic gill symbiont]|uniref:hypothetical protein n=1 Tax=Bathymodiolus platifrons methanotrophic gill symbiont TaxID=113268 RepID=UPI000B71A38D|nr:hypothetical protein [Bathymodiolus platifrons methanotrophic gill symbiont]MCK5869407.1 hypothetical protein [Methyloprofundus sp.]GAW85382.1 conserved hypothetical protein [Bathymodiolus platifrons methanotrophic gill symbiont]
MTNIYRDITIAVLFIAGIWGSISGQFIISTVLFAGATVLSNIAPRDIHNNA